MKLKKLWILVLAAITLSGCTKEVIKYLEGDEKTEDATGTVRIKLAVNADALQTRAAHYDAVPTDEESLIYNYSVFIFNAQGILEATLVASPYSPSTGSNNPLPYTVPLTFDRTLPPNNLYMDENDEITLTSGTKYIHAVVNAPRTLLEEQNEYVANNSLTYSIAETSTMPLKDDNDRNNLGKIVGSFYFEDIDPADYAFENDTTVTGNRGFMMTTKQVYTKYFDPMEDTDPAEPVTLEVGRAMAKVSLTSKLDKGNRNDPNQKNGLLDVWDYKVINNPDQMYLAPHFQGSVLITPYYYDNTVNENKYFASYFDSEYIPASKDGERTYTYCAENTNRTPKKGNSTAAVIKGQYSPHVLLHPDDPTQEPEEGTHNLGEDFWRIRNTETLEYIPGYYASEPDLDALGYDPDEFEAVLYENGECYYIAYLRNEARAMAPYAVHRNSYYKIDVTEVVDAGEADEDDLIPDIEEPIDPETRITVAIKVVEWDEIEQEQKL